MAWSASAIWPEKIRFRTRHPEEDVDLGDSVELIAALRGELARLKEDPESLRRYLGELEPLAASVAPLLDRRPDDPDAVAEHLDAIESLLLGKLGVGASLDLPTGGKGRG